MKKVIYALIDGVADRAVKALGNRTPLEAAYTPNLDLLARKSVFAEVMTVGEGIAPESDIAVFSMLGYTFNDGYPGRGVVEAIGAGLEFRDGYLAMRANFATSNEDMSLIIDRRAGRNLSDSEAKKLEDEINSKITLDDRKASFVFRHTLGHRGVLVIKHEDTLSGDISNTDPGYTRSKGMGIAKATAENPPFEECKPLTQEDAAVLAARLVNEFTRKAFGILSKSEVNRERIRKGFKPANILLLRDAGNRYPKIEEIDKKYGKKFSAVVDMPVEIGISRLAGLDIMTSSKEDYESKVELTLNCLKTSDVVYLHLKGPDEFGHDGMAIEKKESIEQIDRRYFGNLLNRLDGSTVIAVSADHATPCELKAHSDDAVPLMISNSAFGDDGLTKFSEENAKKGSLGKLRGIEVLKKVLEGC